MKDREIGKRKDMALMLTGAVLGVSLVGGAAAAGVMAEPTWQKIYVDGEQVNMTAYNIGGSNFVKLRDIGKEVGFNVYWSDGVQIDSDAPYTGEAPQRAEKPVPSISSSIDNGITGNMEIRQEIITRINQLRMKHGLGFLTINQSLMDAAQEYSTGMYTSHKTKLECELALAHGYPHGFLCNLTAFTGTGASRIAERAVTNWVESKGHLEAMLNPQSEDIGVGVTDNGMASFCYVFIGSPNSHNPYGP